MHWKVVSTPRNFKGESVVAPSCRHVWRWVIVAKPAKQFSKCELPLPHELNSRTHVGYLVVNHAVTIMCADHFEWSRQIRRIEAITRLNTWRSIWLPPHSVITGVKKRSNSLFKFPWSTHNIPNMKVHLLTQKHWAWPGKHPCHVPVMLPDSVPVDLHQRLLLSCLVYSSWQTHRLPRCCPRHFHHHQSGSMYGIWLTDKTKM